MHYCSYVVYALSVMALNAYTMKQQKCMYAFWSLLPVILQENCKECNNVKLSQLTALITLLLVMLDLAGVIISWLENTLHCKASL